MKVITLVATVRPAQLKVVKSVVGAAAAAASPPARVFHDWLK